MGLQFFVNVEIGNLTVSSGACGGTKDASYISEGHAEFGQVASYCIGMKVVQADGKQIEYTENDTQLTPALRSSYGMLGIIVEVTYRVNSFNDSRASRLQCARLRDATRRLAGAGALHAAVSVSLP